MQMVSLRRRSALELPQKFLNFRSWSMLTALKMTWLWMWCLSVWVQTIGRGRGIVRRAAFVVAVGPLDVAQRQRLASLGHGLGNQGEVRVGEIGIDPGG